jgi:hypothetical protein
MQWNEGVFPTRTRLNLILLAFPFVRNRPSHAASSDGSLPDPEGGKPSFLMPNRRPTTGLISPTSVGVRFRRNNRCLSSITTYPANQLSFECDPTSLLRCVRKDSKVCVFELIRYLFHKNSRGDEFYHIFSTTTEKRHTTCMKQLANNSIRFLFGLAAILSGAPQSNGQLLPQSGGLGYVSCLKKKAFQVHLPQHCSFEHLRDALQQKLPNLGARCANKDASLEIEALFDVANETDAKSIVDALCVDAILQFASKRVEFEFERFSLMDQDFNKAFFDGGSSWNEGGKHINRGGQQLSAGSVQGSDKFRGNADRIESINTHVALKRPMSWPDNLENFAQCSLQSAMCCWVDHDEAQDAYYKKNTDLCYVDFSRAPSSSHISSGYSIFDGDEDAFCHGFAWDDGSVADVFKGNLLFHKEIYDHMHKKGLSRNVPGAPMCGCVDKMPVVSRADCSKLEFQGHYIFRYSDSRTPAKADVITRGQLSLNAVDCDGAGVNGDEDCDGLKCYYEELYLEGKVDTNQKTSFDEIIVGAGNCGTAISGINGGGGELPGPESSTPEPSILPTTSSPSVLPTSVPSQVTDQPSFSLAPTLSPSTSPTLTDRVRTKCSVLSPVLLPFSHSLTLIVSDISRLFLPPAPSLTR